MVTGRQRSRQYDGPFRFLVMDFVGPITPKSSQGHEYMFTCTCAWSGWCDGVLGELGVFEVLGVLDELH